MKAYHREIINNVVSYIAREYYNAKGRNITQTLLFKILALLDFRALKQNGRPCIEFTYTARDLGPVPEELYKGDLSLYDSFKTKDKKYQPDIPVNYDNMHLIKDDLVEKIRKTKPNLLFCNQTFPSQYVGKQSQKLFDGVWRCDWHRQSHFDALL